MNFRNAVFLAIAMALTTSGATAAEAVWPRNTVSEVSRFATILRFQIYADHCSGENSQWEAKFDSLMENLIGRIEGISTSLLASDEFKDTQDQLVPAQIFDAIKHSFHDVEHNVERLDAASICSKVLLDFGEVDDEALKSALVANLTAVQKMSQNVEKAGAR